MKTLLVCYSRSGITRGHMLWLKEALAAERLITVRAKYSYNGFFGVFRACREMFTGQAAIEPPDRPPDMAAYDLVVLGAPVWAGRAAAPMRAFLQQYGQGIRRCAYVITHGSSDPCESALDQLDGLTGVARCAALSIGKSDTDADAKRDAFIRAVGGTPS